MNTNLIVSPSPTNERYWAELKNLSDEAKLELIVLLSSSMTHPKPEVTKDDKGWADRYCGVWKDSRSAEQIVDDIRRMRTTNSFEAVL